MSSNILYIDRKKRSRDIKLYLTYLMGGKEDYKNFRIGVTSDSIIMLDFDGGLDQYAIIILKRFLNGSDVAIFESKHGYHVVGLKKVDKKMFRRIYGWYISHIHLFSFLDFQHLVLSRKFMKTTLRINPKDKGDFKPKLVRIV